MQDNKDGRKRENRLLTLFSSNPFGASILLTGMISLTCLEANNWYNGNLLFVIYNQFAFLFCGLVLGLFIDWVSFKKKYR